MNVYRNRNGNSGVIAYTLGSDYIDVQFNKGMPYRYSYRSAGSVKVETMKMLAERGYGLNSYIQRFARFDYEK